MADQLRREIEEIVEKAGELPAPPRRARRPQNPRATGHPRRSLVWNARSALVLGLVLLIVAAIIWGSSGSLGTALALGGILLLVFAYFSYFRNGVSSEAPGGYEKRWRGQTVQHPPSGPSFMERVRQWRNRRR